jgi:flavin-dependent dehydrogenase
LTDHNRGALVIGGGVAGAAVAAGLAGHGRRVVLIERKAAAVDKVCGEFISAEAAVYLGDLGVDLLALGAVPIDAVRVFGRRQLAAARLPFAALSLSRRVLDEAVLRAAGARGAEIRRGLGVQSMALQVDGFTARLDSGETVSATDVFLATGKHDLRGWKRPPGSQSDLIAFKLHWRLRPSEAAALDRHVELYLFPGGYAGLEPVEHGLANLCLVVRQRRFAALGRSWPALLDAMQTACPVLRQRLADARPGQQRPLAIFSIPYGYVRGRSSRLWRVGDQAAVIPSFTGDGDCDRTALGALGDAVLHRGRERRHVSGATRARCRRTGARRDADLAGDRAACGPRGGKRGGAACA